MIPSKNNTTIKLIIFISVAIMFICSVFIALIIYDKKAYDEVCAQIPQEREIIIMLEEYLIKTNLEVKEAEEIRKGKLVVLVYAHYVTYGAHDRALISVKKIGIGHYKWVVEKTI